MRASYVYVLIHEKGKMFKIGKANNVKSRVEQLEKHWGTFQIDNSMILKVKSEKESLNLERMLQRLFEKYNLKNLDRNKDGSSEFFKIECLDILIENLYTISTILNYEIYIVKDILTEKVIKQRDLNKNHSDNLLIFNNEKSSKIFLNLFYYSVLKLEELNYSEYEIKINVKYFEKIINKRLNSRTPLFKKFEEFLIKPFYYKGLPVYLAKKVLYNQAKTITIVFNKDSIIENQYILRSFFNPKYFKEFISLDSLYAQYLFFYFRYLKQNKIHSLDVSVSDLKKNMNVEKSYPSYFNFKERCLLSSLSEINKKTNLNVDFKEIKSGRKVENLKFQIQTQK